MLRSGLALAGPDARASSSTTSRAGSGGGDAVAVSSGTAALHLGVRALGWGEGDEVVTTPLSFVASANCLLYEGAKPVFCDIDPVTLNIDPTPRRPRSGDAHGGHPAGPHLRLPGRPAGAVASSPPSSGSAMLEDACAGARAPSTGTGAQDRRRGQPRDLRLLRQQADDDGGGRHPRHARTRRSPSGSRSERNQGRAPDMDEVEHDRIGFNYRLTDLQAAIGIAQVERLDELLDARDDVAAALPRAAHAARRRARRRGRRPTTSSCPCENAATSGAAGSSSSSSCRRDRPRRGDRLARASRASPPRPTCPASTCCRPTASGSASRAASSRSPSASPSARSRCPSSPR